MISRAGGARNPNFLNAQLSTFNAQLSSTPAEQAFTLAVVNHCVVATIDFDTDTDTDTDSELMH
jgi:hypothetical protein